MELSQLQWHLRLAFQRQLKAYGQPVKSLERHNKLLRRSLTESPFVTCLD